MHGPRCGVFDEQLMPFSLLPLKPVVDCVGRNRSGQRPKVVWRRAGDCRELAETPVGQCGGLTRRLANDEVVGADRLRPEFAGLDGVVSNNPNRGVATLDAGHYTWVEALGWPGSCDRNPPLTQGVS